MPANRHHLRHIVMRLALGFVLAWFGVQELRSPGDWAVFVPNVIANHVPGAVNNLVLLHGFLLVFAATTIVLGLFYLVGCALALAMLGEVVLSLWIDSGMSDLLIRDVGLLGLAAALALDPVRVLRLDDTVVAWWHALRQPATRAHERRGAPEPRAASWSVRAGSGAALVGVLLLVTLVLRVTGDNGAPTTSGAASVYHDQPSPTAAVQPTPSPDASSAQADQPAATPSPASPSAIRFDDWQYRQYAFQVYPGPLSSETQNAIAGFDLSVQDQDATVQLVFKALSTRYQDATISVDRGNTAYFIETNMRDDPSAQDDTQLNDDGVIVVNPQGYIIES